MCVFSLEVEYRAELEVLDDRVLPDNLGIEHLEEAVRDLFPLRDGGNIVQYG